MKNKPSQLFIIGGGPSLNEGIEKGLWKKLENKFTINMNFGYMYFNGTILTFVDSEFYNGYQGKKRIKWKDKEERRLEHIENIKKMPFMVGQDIEDITEVRSNTILLKTGPTYYGRKSIHYNSMYKANLCGLFSLTLGICLLDVGEIYLLGFDSGPIAWIDKNTPYTHFCQKYPDAIKHRGFKQISYYQDRHEERDFGVYKDDPKIKIYNVSLASNIPDTVFPKITYETMFSLINSEENYSQDALRLSLRDDILKQVSIRGSNK